MVVQSGAVLIVPLFFPSPLLSAEIASFFYIAVIKNIARYIKSACFLVFTGICYNLRNIFSGALSVNHVIIHIVSVLPATAMDNIKAIIVDNIVCLLVLSHNIDRHRRHFPWSDLP